MDKSAIRILHASPGTPALDVYLDGELMAQEISYEELTDYWAVKSSEYNVKVLAAGETTNPMSDIDLSIGQGELTTIAVTGVLAEVNLIPMVQTTQCPSSGYTLMRFINLSPDTPLLDVYIGNTLVFSEVEYREVTDYSRINGGSHRVDIGPTGLDNMILQLPELVLHPGQVYSLYWLGRLEGQPDLTAKLIKDSTEHCVREVSSPPPPDAKPYQWRQLHIKVNFR